MTDASASEASSAAFTDAATAAASPKTATASPTTATAPTAATIGETVTTSPKASAAAETTTAASPPAGISAVNPTDLETALGWHRPAMHGIGWIERGYVGLDADGEPVYEDIPGEVRFTRVSAAGN